MEEKKKKTSEMKHDSWSPRDQPKPLTLLVLPGASPEMLVEEGGCVGALASWASEGSPAGVVGVDDDSLMLAYWKGKTGGQEALCKDENSIKKEKERMYTVWKCGRMQVYPRGLLPLSGKSR